MVYCRHVAFILALVILSGLLVRALVGYGRTACSGGECSCGAYSCMGALMLGLVVGRSLWLISLLAALGIVCCWLVGWMSDLCWAQLRDQFLS